MSSYDFFEKTLEENFDNQRVLKETEETRIFLCRHRASGKQFVLRRMAGEASVYHRLTAVSCPGLPRIYEVLEKDGKLLILEEYIQGDSLEMLLEGGLFNEKQTREIGLQVGEALRVLHGIGAVHRDVKLSNVLLRHDNNQAVLIDFDASRILKPEQNNDTVALGTPGYAAPEQYGISQTDERTDIFSLGVMMNYMLTGEHPSQTLAKGHMGRVIRRCTMMNPKQRYRNMLRLMEEL